MKRGFNRTKPRTGWARLRQTGIDSKRLKQLPENTETGWNRTEQRSERAGTAGCNEWIYGNGCVLFSLSFVPRPPLLKWVRFCVQDWTDERLVWTNKTSVLNQLVVAMDNVWRPELAVING